MSANFRERELFFPRFVSSKVLRTTIGAKPAILIISNRWVSRGRPAMGFGRGFAVIMDSLLGEAGPGASYERSEK